MKSIQISTDLFWKLLLYHVGLDDSGAEEIQKKLDAMVQHELYAKYKTAPIEEEREKVRLDYLDRCGVPESFRW